MSRSGSGKIAILIEGAHLHATARLRGQADAKLQPKNGRNPSARPAACDGLHRLPRGRVS
jgi:hypothetical protein